MKLVRRSGSGLCRSGSCPVSTVGFKGDGWYPSSEGSSASPNCPGSSSIYRNVCMMFCTIAIEERTKEGSSPCRVWSRRVVLCWSKRAKHLWFWLPERDIHAPSSAPEEAIISFSNLTLTDRRWGTGKQNAPWSQSPGVYAICKYYPHGIWWLVSILSLWDRTHLARWKS